MLFRFGMHGSTLERTDGRIRIITSKVPVIWVVLSVWSLARQLSAVQERSERAVVRQLNGEAAAGREIEELASRWREIWTARIVLEPVLIFCHLIKWIQRCSPSVLVILCLITVSAVHPI